MFVAFWLHDLGNSTSRCSKATRSPWAMRASRISHSTVSNACWPAAVKKRLTERASPRVTSFMSGVCELPSIVLLLSSSPAALRTLRRFVRHGCGRLWGCALSASGRTESCVGEGPRGASVRPFAHPYRVPCMHPQTAAKTAAEPQRGDDPCVPVAGFPTHRGSPLYFDTDVR